MIERKNRYDAIVEDLNAQETEEKAKSERVVKSIAGGQNVRVIVDKIGRERHFKIKEKRKPVSAYVPESLYEQFEAINLYYGKSNNSAIVELIRDYVTSKKEILE